MQQANIIKEGAIFLHFEELQKKGLFYCRATHNFLFVYFTQNEKSNFPNIVVDLSIAEIRPPQVIETAQEVPPGEKKHLVVIESEIAGRCTLTLPRAIDAEEWFLVLLAAQSMSSIALSSVDPETVPQDIDISQALASQYGLNSQMDSPEGDADNDDGVDDDTNRDHDTYDTFNQTRGRDSKASTLEQFLSMCMSDTPTTSHEIHALQDKKAVDALFALTEQQCEKMKETLCLIRSEVDSLQEECNTLRSHEGIYMVQNGELHDAISTAVRYLKHVIRKDTAQVATIHSLFSSRVKTISLIHKIQKTLEETSVEALLQNAIPEVSTSGRQHRVNSHSLSSSSGHPMTTVSEGISMGSSTRPQSRSFSGQQHSNEHLSSHQYTSTSASTSVSFSPGTSSSSSSSYVPTSTGGHDFPSNSSFTSTNSTSAKDNSAKVSNSIATLHEILELSSRSLETDVKPLLQQFQSLLQFSQVSLLSKQKEAWQGLSGTESDTKNTLKAKNKSRIVSSGPESNVDFDGQDQDDFLVSKDQALEHLFVLSEICTAIRGAANTAAVSIQQLTQARNSIN